MARERPRALDPSELERHEKTWNSYNSPLFLALRDAGPSKANPEFKLSLKKVIKLFLEKPIDEPLETGPSWFRRGEVVHFIGTNHNGKIIKAQDVKILAVWPTGYRCLSLETGHEHTFNARKLRPL